MLSMWTCEYVVENSLKTVLVLMYSVRNYINLSFKNWIKKKKHHHSFPVIIYIHVYFLQPINLNAEIVAIDFFCQGEAIIIVFALNPYLWGWTQNGSST